MMRLGLGVLGLLAAYALGRIKALYYFDAFGIGLGAAGLGPIDVLFESWFVVQNVAFFVVLWWFVLLAGRRRYWVVAVPYSLIPLASHYAYRFVDHPLALGLIDYRHTLLKLIPFVVVVAAFLLDRGLRPRLRHGWPHGRNALILFWIIVGSWAISTAKHFGSYDASRAQHRAMSIFAQVRIPGIAELAGREDLLLVHETAEACWVWDHQGFVFEPGAAVTLLVVPREKIEWLETRKRFRIQPGGQWM